jgi:hypothetical protein
MTTAQSLERLAQRLCDLAPVNDTARGLVSVATGALYALHQAHAREYSGCRDEVPELSHAIKVAEALAARRSPVNRMYLGGYYFNDALLRLDIAYENAIRAVTSARREDDQNALIEAAIARGHASDQFREWRLIRAEVNGFKHRNPRQIARHKAGRGVPPEKALLAAHKLVEFMERTISGRRVR